MKNFIITLSLIFSILSYSQESRLIKYDTYIAELEKNQTKRNQKKITELKNCIEKKQNTIYLANNSIIKYAPNAKVLCSDIQSIQNINSLIAEKNDIELILISIRNKNEEQAFPNEIHTDNLRHLKYILFSFDFEVTDSKAIQLLQSLKNKEIILYKNELLK